VAQRILQLPLTLPEDQVYPFLGMTKHALTPELQGLLRHTLQKVSNLAQPKGVYADYLVRKINDDRLELDGTDLCIQGLQTLDHFRTAKKITLLAVTLGSKISAVLSQFTKAQATEALFFDAVASAATENLAEQLDALISGEIRRQGYYPSARFSPGYGDWALSWQSNIVASLQGEKIGLGVTPYFLLDPVKSITAAIGWSSVPIPRSYDLPVRKKPCQGALSCSHCPLREHCPASYPVGLS